MTQEAAEPAEAPPTPHDAVGDHPDAAPRLKTEIEQQEAAANALREMIDKSDAEDEAERAAQEAALSGEPQGNTEEPIPEDAPDDEEPAEGAEGDADEHQDTDEEAAAKAKRDNKPSFVREARRAQRAARRDRAELEAQQAEFKQQQEQFQQQQAEFQSFMETFKANPIGAMSQRTGIPPEQLLAQQADEQVNQIPPAVQAQLDAQAKELADYKAAVEKERTEAEAAAKQQNYQTLVKQDVSLLAGISDNPDAAKRFPYFASLSKATRERRALSILHYTHAEMDNPEQYTQEDLWDALDEQAKEDHTSLSSSKWLKQSKAEPGQGTRAAEAKPPRRRRGGPSARGAAVPAAPRQPKTEAESIEAAAEWLRQAHKKDAEERER
jgi:hypothetical protein